MVLRNYRHRYTITLSELLLCRNFYAVGTITVCRNYQFLNYGMDSTRDYDSWMGEGFCIDYCMDEIHCMSYVAYDANNL